MAELGGFYTPDTDMLMHVGRVIIKHGHFEHMLRIAIKRMRRLSIDDPEYLVATNGKVWQLRNKVEAEAAREHSGLPALVEVFKEILELAKEASEFRNRIAHTAWMQVPGQEPKLYDRTASYALPTLERMQEVEKHIDLAMRLLDILTGSVDERITLTRSQAT